MCKEVERQLMSGAKISLSPNAKSVIILVLLCAFSGPFGCATQVTRPDVDYYFSHPLLNARWKPEHFHTQTKPRTAAARRGSSHKSHTKKTRSAKTAKQPLSPAPRQELRGNDIKVVRHEMVLAARRLVGIGENVTQDGFIRHILVVNNLGLGRLPKKNVIDWLYGQAGDNVRKVADVAVGDILFLGDGKPEQVVIVEHCSEDSTVSFIGVVGGKVERGTLSLTRRKVRRDEAEKKVLNSYVGKSRLAGSLLVGAFTLSGHQQRLAAGGR
jgi:hypothetical protein